MIKWLSCLALLAFCFPARADFTNAIQRTLQFEYATNDITPATVVLLYTNSNPALPTASWQLWTVVTNLSTSGTNNLPVTVSLPREFFVARASNEWGLGDFSVPLLSAPPREDVKLRVR